MQPVLVEARVACSSSRCPPMPTHGWRASRPRCRSAPTNPSTWRPTSVVARRYQAVNVKLDKAGGLTAALELARAAREAGLGLMTGCMVSSSLSIAPALHVAAMSDFVDLDGPLWLREDRPGGVSERSGLLSPPAAGFWGDG
jgi:L-alanine-DL-glutamate epimerase-like enolase superfamily enzyme